jgi:hypothetical protein
MPQSIADTTTVTLGRAMLAYHGKLETFAAKSRRDDLK